VAAIHVRVMALEFTELGTLARIAGGGSPGAAASLLKNISTEIGQDIECARLEAIHYYGLPYPDTGLPSHADTVAARYLNGRAASIFGGAKVTEEHHRKGVLGLKIGKRLYGSRHRGATCAVTGARDYRAIADTLADGCHVSTCQERSGGEIRGRCADTQRRQRVRACI
jgi:hypothetical protein